MSRLATLEAEFFRTLNLLVEPAVRAGCGFPVFGLTGLIALETKGRRTGLPYSIPVLATLVGDHLLVGTIRGNRSHWIENVRVNPNVRYWLRGRVHEARTLVFTPDESPPETQSLPPLLRYMATSLHSTVSGLGVAFAILIPTQSGV